MSLGKFSQILILLVLLGGCRSKKSVSESSNHQEKEVTVQVQKQIDTVFQDRVVEKIRPVYYEVEIEKPCDSLGNLRPFKFKAGSGGNASQIYTKDGKLYLQTSIDSMQNVFEKDYRSRYVRDSLALENSLISEQKHSKEIIKYVYPWWLWLAIIGGGLLGLLWLFEKFDVFTRIRKLFLKV